MKECMNTNKKNASIYLDLLFFMGYSTRYKYIYLLFYNYGLVRNLLNQILLPGFMVVYIQFSAKLFINYIQSYTYLSQKIFDFVWKQSSMLLYSILNSAILIFIFHILSFINSEYFMEIASILKLEKNLNFEQ